MSQEYTDVVLRNLIVWELALRTGLGSRQYTMKSREADVATLTYFIEKVRRGEKRGDATKFTAQLEAKYDRG
jgi:hypothetical protein